jgi:IS30 family transposase
MSSYHQLSLEERCAIAQLRAAGQSLRQIAAALGRQPSTIAREIKRNSGAQVGYRPFYAQQLTQARRWTGARLERDADLRTSVLDRLARGWSPEQIAGRLAHETGERVIRCASSLSPAPSCPCLMSRAARRMTRWITKDLPA